MRKMFSIALIVVVALAIPVAAPAKDLTKLKIVVTNTNGKPVDRANVIVRFGGRKVVKLGKKVMTQWEMRSTQEGIADIPEMPKGSIRVQVIAKGYQTFGEKMEIKEEEKTVEVKLKPPQSQYSAHQ